MELITHAALGAITGSVVLQLYKRRRKPATQISPKQAMWIGALAGVFPDIDFLTYLISPLHYHAYWHGTYTHSLLLAPFWALAFVLLLSWLWVALSKPSPQRFGVKQHLFWPLYCIALAGILSHIALDVITAWSIGIWLPVSHERVSFGLLFLVDPIFSASILLGLWAVYRRWHSNLIAGCLLVSLAWLGFAYMQKQSALHLAQETVPNSEQYIAAWPQPFSVLHWKLVSADHQGYWTADVRTSVRTPLYWPVTSVRATIAEFNPPDNVQWRYYATAPTVEARDAWLHPLFEPVRDFMTYPIYVQQDELGCQWFTDLLFVIPQQTSPFQYGLCADGEDSPRVIRKPLLE
ncbi:MAG: metal-dependent hydrolase [Idiomarina sp.]|nr:metal-dependent hydrolase [Idiomarina sp.]